MASAMCFPAAAAFGAGAAPDNVVPTVAEAERDVVVDTDLGGFYNDRQPVVMPLM